MRPLRASRHSSSQRLGALTSQKEMSMPTLLEVAQARVGIKETPGAKSNPIIDKWADDVGWPNLSDNDAWCSIFANAAALEAGLPMTAHNVRPLARGWLTWGTKVELSDIQPGDIAVWPRGKSTWQGHVNIVESISDVGMVVCIGGNQSNAVTRTKPLDPKDALGFRRAVAATVPALRQAGSSEIKKADRIQNGGWIVTIIPAIGAAIKEITGPVSVPQFADMRDAADWWSMLIGAFNALAGLLRENIWVSGTLIVGLLCVLVGRQLKAARLAKHAAGVPLSSQVEAANAG
jgi:uncharacterized protein (TIGR02594 family)